MGLVETDSKPLYIRLRVYRRTNGLLILLWDKLPQLAGKRPTISAKCIEDGKVLDSVSFMFDNDITKVTANNDDLPPNFDGYICIIPESKNGMDQHNNYYVTVSYANIVRQGIRVFRAGVLPDHETEDAEKNAHTYLWDATRQRWRKQEGVEIMVDLNGKKEKRFVTAVTVIPCPNCGYTGDK